MRKLVLVAAFVGIPAMPVAAQSHSNVSGLVRDTSGAPVRDALVSIVALNMVARTDTAGAFRLLRVPAGRATFLIRRMGFAPVQFYWDVTGLPSDTMNVTLRSRPLELAPIVVSERETRRFLYIDDFYRRRERGQGHFITRAEIEARRTSRLSDVVRSIPGLRLVRTRGGFGVRFVSAASVQRDCAPMIWLDGQRAPGMELDELQASDIEGIELYNGPSTTPLRFSQHHFTTCGTIVIWTRLPGT